MSRPRVLASKYRTAVLSLSKHPHSHPVSPIRTQPGCSRLSSSSPRKTNWEAILAFPSGREQDPESQRGSQYCLPILTLLPRASQPPSHTLPPNSDAPAGYINTQKGCTHTWTPRHLLLLEMMLRWRHFQDKLFSPERKTTACMKHNDSPGTEELN